MSNKKDKNKNENEDIDEEDYSGDDCEAIEAEIRAEKEKEFQVVLAQQKAIEQKCDELVSLLKDYEGSKSDITLMCCFELVNYGSYNHFEALGIVSELGHRYREVSQEVMQEMHEDECDECGEAHDMSDYEPNIGQRKPREKKKVEWN